jgi:hypothetical protein
MSIENKVLHYENNYFPFCESFLDELENPEEPGNCFAIRSYSNDELEVETFALIAYGKYAKFCRQVLEPLLIEESKKNNEQ